MLINTVKPSVPAIPLHDSRFNYVPAVCTNVQATWARFGWTPPSQGNTNG
jgi:hypothetical protein